MEACVVVSFAPHQQEYCNPQSLIDYWTIQVLDVEDLARDHCQGLDLVSDYH